MAQKMTLTAYLTQRGKKAKALTRGEADLLGIPFPLQAGWPRKYGAMEIGEAVLGQLAKCVEVARQQAVEKARLDRPKPRAVMPANLTIEPCARLRVVHGFVLRPARRRFKRKAAPWS